MIIDTHSHPFGPSGKKHPFMYPLRSRDELPEEKADETKKSMCSRHVRVMDELGIVKRVFLPLPPMSNDFVARAVSEYPDRFIGYAYVYVVEAAELNRELDEMERAVKDLGLKGFKLYPIFHGKTMSAPELRPIFEKANELKIPMVFDVHIIVRGFVELKGYREPEYGTGMEEIGLRRDAHNPARLIYTDYMDGLDDLVVILAHFGGGIYFYRDWPSIHNPSVDKAFGLNWGGMPRERFDKFYYDMSYPYPLDTPYPSYPDASPLGPDSFYEQFINTVGADRVLFGTDSTFYPEVVKERTRRQIEMIKRLNISEEDKEKIRWKNAAKLYGYSEAELRATGARWEQA
jgi:predicted TIM-barrel fold metal-dependent hydrolase